VAVYAGVLAALSIVVGVALVAGAYPFRAWGTSDPGILVRLGAPVLRLAVDAAATVCAGSLGYTVFFTGPQPGTAQPPGMTSPQGYAALRTAGRWATVWCVAALLLLPFDAAATSGLRLHRVLTRGNVRTLLDALEAPKAWLLTAGVAAVVAVGSRLALRWRAAWLLLGLTLFAVLPPLAVGHSASQTGHDLATAAIMVHVPVAVLWLGVLVALGRAGRRVLPGAVVWRRYRRLALACWLALAGSGAVDAAVLAPTRAAFSTGYGLLLGAKVAILATLGVFGVLLRRRATHRASGRDRPGWPARLLAAEVLLLAAAFGASVGLAHLPPPAFLGRWVDGEQLLLGYHLSGPPSLARLVLDWRVEVLFSALSAVLAGCYVAGVWRLRRSGRRWPAGRTASWLAGCLLLLFATSSGLGRYAPAMFSLQTAAHMLIGMLAPLLFALGGPLSLAEAALPAAAPGEPPGPREWLAEARRSTLARVLTQPLVCLPLFAGAPFLLYFTPAFDVTVRYHWAHLAMDAGFLAIGYLFAWSVVGVDPLPRPMPDLLRLATLVAAMPFDIVFGAAIIGSRRIIGNGDTGANLYSALSLPWVHNLPADQRLGGVIALVIGEVALLLALVVLVARWSRADGGADDRGSGGGYEELVAALSGPQEAVSPSPMGSAEGKSRSA
jgi:cytochrome c oxidase assembly factor CtaG/putative copper export protein